MWNSNSGYQPWKSGEGSGSGEHCVIMRSNEDDYAFIDYPCTGQDALAVCRYNPRERGKLFTPLSLLSCDITLLLVTDFKSGNPGLCISAWYNLLLRSHNDQLCG